MTSETTTEAPATGPQAAFLTKLLQERGLPTDEVAGHTKRSISARIDEVKALPRPARQAARPAAAKAAVPNGTYTVVLPSGRVTLQLTSPEWARGSQALSYLSGPDNELSYTAIAFADDRGVRLFGKYRGDRPRFARQIEAYEFLAANGVREAHERFLDEAEAYALRSGRCMRCAHKLTVPASLHRGLGPVCAGLEGVA